MKTIIDSRDPNIWFLESEIKAAKKYYKYYAADQKRPRLTDKEKAYNRLLAKCETLDEIVELYNAEVGKSILSIKI